MSDPARAEHDRLQQNATREKNWSRWGPYLSERQWGTVREDYSRRRQLLGATFPHDHARSRAYRSGEDGLLGISDRSPVSAVLRRSPSGTSEDPILKERLFGLTNAEGNHGEDVKEYYFYLDALPTALVHEGTSTSTRRRAFPYDDLLGENRRRGRDETASTSCRHRRPSTTQRYFDVFVEYAKAGRPDDICDPDDGDTTAAPKRPGCTCCRTLWFRNTWSWGRRSECYAARRRSSAQRRPPSVGSRQRRRPGRRCTLELDEFDGEFAGTLASPRTTPTAAAVRHRCGPRTTPCKDAFHDAVVRRRTDRPPPTQPRGTKVAFHCARRSRPASYRQLRLRLQPRGQRRPSRSAPGSTTSSARGEEADAFYDGRCTPGGADEEAAACSGRPTPACSGRSSSTGTTSPAWLDGDPGTAAAAEGAAQRPQRRLAAPLQPRRRLDAGQVGVPVVRRLGPGLPHVSRSRASTRDFAKDAAAAVPARVVHGTRTARSRRTSSNFGDVNPPVHAWACWRVYKMTGKRGARDVAVPQARVPQAAAQLHLVGQPEGRARQQRVRAAASSASTTSACSTAAKAAADGRPPRAGGRHGLDGRSTAARC